MSGDNTPDYRALFLIAEEERKREAELRKRAEEEQKRAEDGRRLAEDAQRLAEARIRRTTFLEFIRTCHTLLSLPLRVEASSRSTKGSIPIPKGKYCPTKLEIWSDFPVMQQELYTSVCKYLHPPENRALRLFSPVVALEDLGRRISRRPLSSEQDLEGYARFAVEDHVHDVIAELCKIPDARREFHLGDGIRFENHANSLVPVDTDQPGSRRANPDQFCIHRIDGGTDTLLTIVEYKPPHKLSVENLRAGLRPMDFWETVVKPRTIPTDKANKLKYNAEQISGSVLAQHYDTMIESGTAYAWFTNGLALVMLHVPEHEPGSLYYYLCEPNLDVDCEHEQAFHQPKTSIARALCLCLMSFRSPPRSQEWRNAARAQLPVWKTSFDYTLSEIPDEELRQAPPGSEYNGSEYTSSEYTGSEYLPSSPLGPPDGRRARTQPRHGCSPFDLRLRNERTDSPESDTCQPVAGEKRRISHVTQSPPSQRTTRSSTRIVQRDQSKQSTSRFCTQRCLHGLHSRGILDFNCPNVVQHQRGRNVGKHQIDDTALVTLLKLQLDNNLDHNCLPLGISGRYGSLFKITSEDYGYTLVGKGTTSELWQEVSREREIYRVLHRAQGSAIPVFLGAINLAKIYFLHSVGQIRHLLLMAWGGNSISKLEQSPQLQREIWKSKKEIQALGVKHEDLRPENILWNDELQRALIIDFHHSKLDPRPTGKRAKKRPLCNKEEVIPLKRQRILSAE